MKEVIFCEKKDNFCDNECLHECNPTKFAPTPVLNEIISHIPCVPFMPNGSEKPNRKIGWNKGKYDFINEPPPVIKKDTVPTKKQPMTVNFTLTEEQDNARAAILNNAITILHGIAGSGKTMTSARTAVELFFSKDLQNNHNCNVKKIIFCTPIPDNDELGFLRGTLEEKMKPRLKGITDILEQVMPHAYHRDLLKLKAFQAYPLSHIRGLTFNDSFVIVDEAQNCTPTQLRLLVSRLGKTSKLVFCGDVTQIDLKDITDSGFPYFKNIAKENIEGFACCEFANNNRHKIIDSILAYYSY